MFLAWADRWGEHRTPITVTVIQQTWKQKRIHDYPCCHIMMSLHLWKSWIVLLPQDSNGCKCHDLSPSVTSANKSDTRALHLSELVLMPNAINSCTLWILLTAFLIQWIWHCFMVRVALRLECLTTTFQSLMSVSSLHCIGHSKTVDPQFNLSFFAILQLLEIVLWHN